MVTDVGLIRHLPSPSSQLQSLDETTVFVGATTQISSKWEILVVYSSEPIKTSWCWSGVSKLIKFFNTKPLLYWKL